MLGLGLQPPRRELNIVFMHEFIWIILILNSNRSPKLAVGVQARKHYSRAQVLTFTRKIVVSDNMAAIMSGGVVDQSLLIGQQRLE